tara:strand:- start:24852 stop:26222 length:1371 start_codon:yes stop_codon:yes gene_type:complete
MAYTTTPGIPSAFQVATNENYVSTLSIHQPEVAEDFVNRYGEQSLMGFLDSIGAMAPVAQRKYEHYEDDYLHQNFKQTGTPTIAVGGTTITLDPAFSSDGTTAGNFFIRIGDIVQNSYGEIALVTAKPANNQATLVPYKNASWTALAATDVLIVIGNEHAEGTGQPDGITPTANHYENYTMIMKDSFQVTGSEATNKIWFKVNDAATGKSGYLWYLKGEGDTYKRFNNYCEMQMLLGQVATNTNAALTGTIGSGGINGTEGLIDFMRSGNSQTYNQLAGFNLSDFDSMIRTLDANRGAKENTMWCGIDLSLAIDDAVAAMFAGGGISYGAFNGSEEIGVAFGFKSFARGGYTFHKKAYEALSYSPMMGATGYNYSGMGLVIPGDMGKDAKSRESIPSLRVRYKEAGGYSRKMEHWLTGSAGLANPTSDVDELRCHYRTERGFEGFANNRFILLERA